MTAKTAAERRAIAHRENWEHLEGRLAAIEEDFRRQTTRERDELEAALDHHREVEDLELAHLRDVLEICASREAALLRQRATACLSFRGEDSPQVDQRQALLGHFKELLSLVSGQRSAAKKEAKAEIAEAKAALDAAQRMFAVATSGAAAERDEAIARALGDWGRQWQAIVDGMADEAPAPGLFDELEG